MHGDNENERQLRKGKRKTSPVFVQEKLIRGEKRHRCTTRHSMHDTA